MSLQVWLPLNGNIKNYGLCGDVLTSSGITFADGGKIGAKYLSGGTITIPAAISNTFFNRTGMSFAFWLYPIGDSGNGIIMGQDSMTAGNNRMYSMFQYSTPNHLHLSWQDETSNSTFGGGAWSNFFSANVWTHCCITYNGSIIKIYRNGTLYTTVNAVSKRNSFNYNFPIWGNAIRKLNDVRIYDHCLSAKEVKIISQGLILHYPLNDPYNEPSQNLCTVARPNAGSNVTWGGHVTQWILYDATDDPVPFNDGIKAEIIYGQNGSTGGGASRSICTIAALPSTTYTYSCYIKASDNFEYVTGNFLYKYEYTSEGNKITEAGYFSRSRMEEIKNGWYRIWGTFTTQSNTNAINISFYTYPLKSMHYYIGGWQIEQKEHATPFMTPNTNRNINIVYDTSGYCNNGMVIETLITTNDTIRYDISTSFNGTTSGIIINNLALNDLINNNITYSFWIKPNGENGARSVYFGSYDAASWSIEKNANNLLRLYWNGSPDEICSGATITDGIWQHICITKNGSNDVKVYINGQQKWSSTAAHNTLTFPTTYRIGRDVRSGDGTPYKGLMSDFRIYATALSVEDIAELYSVGASIDKDGNLYTNMIQEL